MSMDFPTVELWQIIIIFCLWVRCWVFDIDYFNYINALQGKYSRCFIFMYTFSRETGHFGKISRASEVLLRL